MCERRKKEWEREKILRGKTSGIKTDFLLNNTTKPCSLFIVQKSVVITE